MRVSEQRLRSTVIALTAIATSLGHPAATIAGAFSHPSPTTRPILEQWKAVDPELANLLRDREQHLQMIPALEKAWGPTATAVVRRRAELTSIDRRIELRAAVLNQGYVIQAGKAVPREAASLPPLFGDLRSAKRIMVLIDAQYVGINRIAAMKRLLESDLMPHLVDGTQAFEIVFYSGDAAGKTSFASTIPNGPTIASPESKTRACNAMVDFRARGFADPLEALRFAYGRKPDAIVFHCWERYGEYTELICDVGVPEKVQPQLTKKIRNRPELCDSLPIEAQRLDPTGRVRVHSLFVGSPDADDLALAAVRLASQSGGTFRLLDDKAFDQKSGQ